MRKDAPRRRFPPWLKKRLPAGSTGREVRDILRRLKLDTVCRSALCPNIGECFHKRTATFLIMGPNCTRRCRFCAVEGGPPAPLADDEPERVAQAAGELGLKHVVVTSVTRDDLPDGGAAHFARVIEALRRVSDATVEVLVPDFLGSERSIRTVVVAGPDVFNHNVETVPRLYPAVRPEADYRRSLEVLATAKALDASCAAKSGLMVGVGETADEVEEVFSDLLAAGCSIVTVGQYLAPGAGHLQVERFVEPEEFERLERRALEMGFRAARCGPFVRSSYCAEEVFRDSTGDGGTAG